MRNDIAVRAVAALRAREAVFDAHSASVLELAGVGLPDGSVRFIAAGDRAAGGGECQAVGKLLHEPRDLTADAVERVAGDVVAIAVGRARQREHVAGGNVNRHVVEGRLHHAAGPAALVSRAHLLEAIRVRRGGKQERRKHPAAKEIGVERHRAQRHAGQDDVTLGAVLELGARFAANEGVGFRSGVLAAGHGFHDGGRAEHHVAGVEDPAGIGDRHLRAAADGGNYQIKFAEHL